MEREAGLPLQYPWQQAVNQIQRRKTDDEKENTDCGR